MVVITSGLADSRPVAFEILLALADG